MFSINSDFFKETYYSGEKTKILVAKHFGR